MEDAGLCVLEMSIGEMLAMADVTLKAELAASIVEMSADWVGSDAIEPTLESRLSFTEEICDVLAVLKRSVVICAVEQETLEEAVCVGTPASPLFGVFGGCGGV